MKIHSRFDDITWAQTSREVMLLRWNWPSKYLP